MVPTCGIVTLKAQPKSATATYGTPAIDGTIDSVWDDAPTIDVNTFSVGNGATGTAKMLWDENNLYVLTEVTDPVLSKSSANAYEQDKYSSMKTTTRRTITKPMIYRLVSTTTTKRRLPMDFPQTVLYLQPQRRTRAIW